jgi:predicted nucleic acid-binding protein
VRLFLDTSVLLAACASAKGASREIFRIARMNGWVLLATPYVVEEVLRNLPDFPLAASGEWVRLRAETLVMDDVLTLNRPVVFPVSKDKPVLFGALAWADVLLTLDRRDFGALLGTSFYGMPVLRPGDFLEREREAGRLRVQES